MSLLATLLSAAALLSSVSPPAAAQGPIPCEKCVAPKFHKHLFYLPYCTTDAYGKETTHNNLCDAICSVGEDEDILPMHGSCDSCEKRCGAPVFSPVCSADQEVLYPNECWASCAGVEDGVRCDGFKQPGAPAVQAAAVPRLLAWPYYAYRPLLLPPVAVNPFSVPYSGPHVWY